MLAVFYGTDRNRVNEAAKKRLEVFIKKHPGAETFALGDENFSVGELERLTGSTGLFTASHAVVVSQLLTHDEHGEALADHLESLAKSDNLFIFKEGKLLVAQKKLVDKYASESEEFTEKVIANNPDFKNFPIFDLAAALGMRDKKNLWLGYQRALGAGVAAEEIHGVLMWQARTMLQVAAGADADLKPFVVGKAKSYLTKYPGNEAKELSFALVSLYHDARRGLVNMEKGLERLILGI